MNSKKWVFMSFLTSAICLFSIIVVVYLFNLNYYFNHNYLGLAKFSGDERKYKVNYIENNQNSYDSILLGSSSTSFINENDFDDFKVFNFSVSGMIPIEYSQAIKYLESKNNKEIKNIFLNIEFFTSNHNEVKRIKKTVNIDYISEKEEYDYLIKELLNLTALKKIIIRSTNFFEPKGETYYSRWDNIHHHINNLNKSTVNHRINKGIKAHILELKKYKYNSNYKNELMELKNHNLDKIFYTFITPVAKPYMDLIITERFNSYVRWLEETIEVFNNVYIYPYSNRITDNYLETFRDNRHYNSSTGSEIVNDMFNESNNKYILLTRENLNEYIAGLQEVRAKLISLN